MAFERKETPVQEPNSMAWTILKWYWLLVPTLYFLFVLPNMVEGTEAPLLQAGDVFNWLFHLLNIALAGIMTQTHPLERSRSGAADKILKIAIIQQLLTQNILGVGLSIYVWYKLPHKVKSETVSSEEAEKRYFQPKTLYILTGVVLSITVLAIISQFALI